MKITVQPTIVAGEEVRFWIDQQYFDAVELEKIVPEPDSVAVAGDRRRAG